MADRTMQQTASAVATPQHYMPPTMRELRAQSVHRLQIGLAGLAAMLLLVGLANMIMQRAQDSSLADGPVSADVASKAGEAGDPLAEIGAAPSAGTTASASPAN